MPLIAQRPVDVRPTRGLGTCIARVAADQRCTAEGVGPKVKLSMDREGSIRAHLSHRVTLREN
jgi:hypothetical protein